MNPHVAKGYDVVYNRVEDEASWKSERIAEKT